MTGALTFSDASGFILDGVNILDIDTSIDTLSDSSTSLATSGAIKSYIHDHVTDSVGAWNGLKETDTSIGLAETANLVTDVMLAPQTAAVKSIDGIIVRIGDISNDKPIRYLQTSSYLTQFFYNATSNDPSWGGGYQATSIGINDASLQGIILKAEDDGSGSNSKITIRDKDIVLQHYHTGGESGVDVSLSISSLGNNGVAKIGAWRDGGALNLFAGLEYKADYRAHYSDRSLVDKKYVLDLSTNYVQKTGDTMSGGLQVGSGVGSGTDVSIYGGLYVEDDVTIGGTLTVDGSMIVRGVETIEVSAGYIYLNQGEVGTPPASMQSGIVVGRGTENPYVFVYDESEKEFRIGESSPDTGSGYSDASTQAVATREDAPQTTGVAFWNDTESRFDTNTGLTFASATGLAVTNGLSLTSLLATTTENSALILDGTTVKTRSLGDMAWATATDYVTQSVFDASILSLDTSINTLFSTKLDDVLSAGSGSASPYSLISVKTDNTVYMKDLVGGAGTTITSTDGSTLTISVTGAAAVVSKYVGTFDPTGITTYAITGATHEIDASLFQVVVYEDNEQVYTDVVVNKTTKLITLNWASGALTGTIDYIITG